MLMKTPGIGDNQSEDNPGNWIAISREIEHHPIVGFGQPMKPANPKRGAYSRNEAWQFLLFRAEWRRKRVTNKGRVIWLERGELMGGIAWFAEQWNWTKDAVRWFLKQLEGDMMVVRHNTNSDARLNAKSTGIISVCKYDKYQLAQDLEHLLNPNSNTNSDDDEHQLGTNSHTQITPTWHQLGTVAEQGFSIDGESANTNLAPTRTHEPHQHLEQETREQDNYTDARKREPVPQPVPENLEDRLCEAAGRAIANQAACPGLIVMSDPFHWLESGCHLEHDILPAIKARAAKARPASIRSWSYFSEVVFEARDRRLAPAPDPIARAGPSKPDWRDEARARADRAEAALNELAKGSGNG